jgi:methylase of polypeptide subunit release factors
MTHERLEVLQHIFTDMLAVFTPDNEHEQLLCEHLSELKQKVQKLLQRSQLRYFLHLTNTEAMAFYQLWHEQDLKHEPYHHIIITKLIAHIEKHTQKNICIKH